MYEKFYENVKVHKVQKFGEFEEYVILSSDKLRDDFENSFIECFVHSNQVGKFREGETTKVRFELVCYGIDRSHRKEKKLIYNKRTPTAVNRYTVLGQIIEKLENNLVIDSITYIFTKLKDVKEYQKGDFVKAEGRLDAYKVDEYGKNKNSD